MNVATSRQLIHGCFAGGSTGAAGDLNSNGPVAATIFPRLLRPLIDALMYYAPSITGVVGVSCRLPLTGCPRRFVDATLRARRGAIRDRVSAIVGTGRGATSQARAVRMAVNGTPTIAYVDGYKFMVERVATSAFNRTVVLHPLAALGRSVMVWSAALL
jgi:hypothetical protein